MKRADLKNTKRFEVRMEEEHFNLIRKIAFDKKVSINLILNEAIRKYLGK